MYTQEKQNKFNLKMLFVVLLITVVLVSCVFIGTLLAWLQTREIIENSDSVLGTVDLELYGNGTLITGTTTTTNGITHWECDTPYTVASSVSSRSVNLKFRNVGNIDALVRATIRVFYIDNNNNEVNAILTSTPSALGFVSMNIAQTWVTDFPAGVVLGGNMFYNQKVSPYVINNETISANEISIFTNLNVSSLQASTTFYITVTLDAIAYSGNIYKKVANNQISVTDIPVQAYPFGTKESLPSGWTAWE